jgi:hypothetical protein
MRRGLLVAALACLLPMGGLAASPAAADDASPAPAGAAVLLDAGAEPRAELRYAWQPDTAFQLTQDVNQSFELNADGQPSSFDMPTLRFVVEVTTSEARAEGAIRLDFRYLAAGLAAPDEPEVEAAMAEAFEPVLSLSGWAIVDDRGQVLDGGIEGAEVLDPSLASTVSDFERLGSELANPLPVEPVGVGARWRVTQSIPASGLLLEQTVDYTLTDRTDDRVTLAMESTQDAERGPVEGLGIPSAVLVNLEGSGSGTLSFAPDLPVPTSSLEMDLQMSLRAGGAPIDMAITAVSDIRPGAEQVWP